MLHYQKDQNLQLIFQGVIYTHSMGVLLLWQKHLCSELIDSPMRLEMFSVHLFALADKARVSVAQV